jgi:ATP-dependent helicase/nuclease subunit A
MTRRTADQLVAADPAQSVWVAANAGTGKTQVLVDRISRLLLAGTAPHRILCLTFTKAAAAEMADRLNRRLGAWAVMDDAGLTGELADLLGTGGTEVDLGRARRLFAQCLEVPGGLKIQTLHAFCESLLSRFPLEAGVSPHFAVMDERTAAELLKDARDRVIAAPDSEGAMDRLAALVDESQFDGVLHELLAGRGRLSRLLKHHGSPEGLVAAAYRALDLPEGETDPDVLAGACAAGAYDEAGLRRACKALSEGTKTDWKRMELIQSWLDAPAERRPDLFGGYAGAYLTDKGEPRARLATTGAIAADALVPEILEREQLRVLAVAERRKAVAVAEATATLVDLGARVLETYRDSKELRALLDYEDLILAARDLLRRDRGVSWVLFKLDGGLDHVLVDEAQDTSPEQWEIVAALAEEFFAGEAARPPHRTLFVVGDEKQSIYSFQGAHPEGFALWREHFAERARAARERLLPVEMPMSFRSTAAVLRTVDAVFSDPAARDGLLSGDRPIRHQWSRRGQAGLVELWPTLTPEEVPEDDPWDAPLDQLARASPASRLADRVADTIKGWLDRGEILESKGRPIRPGDVMVLVRTRTAFVERLVRGLKQRGIPVAGTDRMVLTEQLAVMDLVAVGRFALLPQDDLTLAIVLKGPLVGFDEETLFDLAHGRERSLWDELRARRADFPAAHSFLSGLLARADATPPFEFFARLLGREGGRERLLARLGPDANDPIDEFLALSLAFEREHVPSLQGFLHWLEAGRAEVKRDMEQGQGQVRVMTVHGAKGLQAPVVFLPDTCSLPARQREARLLWRLEGGEPVLLWPVRSENETPPCKELRAAARGRGDQEYRRLLYVAMTRAEDRLYVAGHEGRKGRPPGCWYDLVAAAVLEPENADGEVWRIAEPQTEPPEGDRRPVAPALEPQSPPDWCRRAAPEEPAPPKPLAPSRPESEEPPVRSPLAADDGARFRRGRLVHRLLQSLPDLAPEDRPAAALAFLARPGLGLAPGEGNALAAEVLAVLDHPEAAPLFAPGSRAEVPIVGLVGGRALSAQVDRLAIRDGEVLVVDYKTNRPPPQRPEGVARLYLAQMAAYRAVLSLVYPGKAVRCFLLWTDVPRLMELPDVLLAPHTP